ncbi:hypothetical protein J8L98_07130 [Pseudoalteromonas sp. MMG013]|uniref:DUF350 domain-containing protein n=1 Tax=Pseudoalteromonas aurantia 208 TaxID=1314867 RepID=A0ABR9E794_9GAMM|nr:MULTISPECIES: hypothetical protein [Pseudoalteromonas]MBE0366854.1 hypothetical protein [Pseudoalteromonas aurantia 208]MBQ4847032.1 hypothetical protein [Pseudoalteromonas sp. MMG005]MBQ4849598.1 hypothetical protein [Pseudoalteromonas sp. MMG012]MBQ4861462.1 hypothetical protein [Pseudoalteromonas sp. MMG013]
MSYLSLANINFFAIISSFLIICLVVTALRLIIQYKAKQILHEEVAKRDNFALGINYACQIAVICISIAYLFDDISMAAAQKQPLRAAVLLILILAYISAGQYIHRKWILYKFNEEQAILKQNICAALVDSGMLIANCILVLALYHWVHPRGISDLLVVTLGFILLQGIFALDSKLRESRFAKVNQGASLQQNFNLANTSIGIRYAGKTIGLALAIYAGLHSAPYHGATVVENLFSVVLHCGAMWVLLYVASTILLQLSLPKVDIGLEVDHQDNIGVACLEFAVFAAIGYLLINMFSV